jgi:hypothetical protein
LRITETIHVKAAERVMVSWLHALSDQNSLHLMELAASQPPLLSRTSSTHRDLNVPLVLA